MNVYLYISRGGSGREEERERERERKKERNKERKKERERERGREMYRISCSVFLFKRQGTTYVCFASSQGVRHFIDCPQTTPGSMAIL